MHMSFLSAPTLNFKTMVLILIILFTSANTLLSAQSQNKGSKTPGLIQLFQEGQYNKLVTHLERRRLKLQDKDKKLSLKEYELLIISYQKLKNKNPEALEYQNKLTKAMELFIQNYPKNYRPYYLKTKILFAEGRETEARTAITFAIGLKPKNRKVYELGLKLFAENNREIIEISKKMKAIQSLASLPFVSKNLCISLVKMEYTLEAKKFCKEAFEKNPNDLCVLKAELQIYLNEGDDIKTEEMYKKIIKKFPKNSNIYYEFALFYRARSKYILARNHLETAAALDSKNTEIIHATALNLFDLKNYKEALVILQSLCRKQSRFSEDIKKLKKRIPENFSVMKTNYHDAWEQCW